LLCRRACTKRCPSTFIVQAGDVVGRGTACDTLRVYCVANGCGTW
jgi:hypothetical protein